MQNINSSGATLRRVIAPGGSFIVKASFGQAQFNIGLVNPIGQSMSGALIGGAASVDVQTAPAAADGTAGTFATAISGPVTVVAGGEAVYSATAAFLKVVNNDTTTPITLVVRSNEAIQANSGI